jgi:hypothetical protein
MGDFNETTELYDRFPRSSTTSRFGRRSMIQEVLLNHGWRDAFTQRHAPPVDLENDTAAADSNWFTFQSHEQGDPPMRTRSRIDHCLVFGFSDRGSVYCDHLPPVAPCTQHNLVSVLVPGRVLAAQYAHKIVHPARPRVNLWSDDQWVECADAVATRMHELGHLLDQIEGETDPARARALVDQADRMLRDVVLQVLRQVAGFTSGRPRVNYARCKLMKTLTALARLKNAQNGQSSNPRDMDMLLHSLAKHDRDLRGLSVNSREAKEVVLEKLRNVRRDLKRLDSAAMDEAKQRAGTESALKTVQHVMSKTMSPPLLAVHDARSGELVNNPKQMKKMLADHFEAQFKRRPTAGTSTARLKQLKEAMYAPVIVPAGCYDRLMLPCTVAEVKQHAFPTRLVAAGADAISGGVLGHLVRRSDVVAGAVCRLYTACLRLGFTPTSARHSEIVPLIKKAMNLPGFNNLRPISLQLALFKGLQRLIAMRLGAIFTEHPILHPAQEAFLPQHSTHRAVEVVNNVFAQARKHHRSCFSIFYDISKAYDCVEHDDLVAALRRLGMPASFVDYVINSLVDLTACVRTVYGLSRRFNVERGIRQGDPLAPLLFICLMDVLHCALHKAGDGHAGFPFRLSQGRITQTKWIASTGFADDTWVVSHTREGMDALHNVNLKFCEIYNFDVSAT